MAERQNVKELIRDLVRRGDVANRDVVAAADRPITRQAVHHHLRQMVEDGELEPVGEGRARRYRLAARPRLERTYPANGLAEDAVWNEVERDLPDLRDLAGPARSALHYAFTEMLNNAIDHAQAADVRVRVEVEEERVAFEVVDDGVGVFPHVASRLDLDDPREAIVELSKGKLTTLPARHSGEGIFFTSKVVDVFVLESAGLRWTVDNERGDEAVGDVAPRPGTRVRCEIDPQGAREPAEIFAAYTDDDLRFSRTRTRVRLADVGERFVSRSEAKRIANRLEEFDQVVLDFAGVTEVGQGFVDELFRVWAARHPGTVLEPVNLSPAVEFMVRRGLRDR